MNRQQAMRPGLAAALAGAIALFGVIVLFGAGRASAGPSDDKARIDRQLAQAQATYEGATAQARTALRAYTIATAQLSDASGRLSDAVGIYAARQVDAHQAQRDAHAARTEQSGADRQYRDAVGQVTAARTRTSSFVAAAYRGDRLSALGALLESRSPTEVADRLTYLDRVANNQRRAMDGFLAARMVAKEADNAAVAAKRRAEAAADQARDALASARAARDEAASARAGVAALRDTRARAMAAANAQRDATLAQYTQLKAESDRIAAQLRAIAAQDAARRAAANAHQGSRPSGSGAGGSGAGHGGAQRTAGFFLTPVHGWKSSDFGMRYDPYYQVWQLHAGVDLAAPGGAPIHAAADGQVVRAGWNGGYGNYTCLYHGLYQGKGLSTCYGHQSAILVKVGQRVSRGEVIGRVGTTGASTGYHLHFEVRLDGTPVQPLDWLDACLC